MLVLKGIFGGSPKITLQKGKKNPKGLKWPEKILRDSRCESPGHLRSTQKLPFGEFISRAETTVGTKIIAQKPGNHPNFRKNALGVKGAFSELSESSGVFSEQLSELEIPFSEYEIPFSEWPLTTWSIRNPQFSEQLSERFPELPRTHPKDFHLPLHSRSVFSRIGVVPAHQNSGSGKMFPGINFWKITEFFAGWALFGINDRFQ